MKTKTKPHKLLSMLLALVMVVGMLPATSLTAYAAGATTGVQVYDKTTGAKRTFTEDALYYTNGAESAGSLKDNPNWNAHYNPTTKILELKDYDGGRIDSEAFISDALTIKLIGVNTVTATNSYGIESKFSGGVIITSESGGSLTINVTSEYAVVEGISTERVKGNVSIQGDAKVTVNAISTYTKKINDPMVCGIRAAERISILEDAYVTVTCKSADPGTSGYGILAKNGITFNTNGNVNIDTSNAGNNSNGIFVSGGYVADQIQMTKVSFMTIKYTKDGVINCSPIYPSAIIESAKDSYAININESTGVATYRYGTPVRTVTVTNGTCDASGKSTGQFLAGDTVKVTANDAPEGYQLKGWTSDDVSVPDISVLTTSFTMPDNDVVIKAEYKPVSYIVTFDANGHGTAPKAQSVENGKTATKPTDLTADGWTFCGWYKDAECTEYFDFSTAITNNITLYAAWTQGNTYTVTFNANGHGTAPEPQIVKEGGKATRPATDPTAEGWIFGGWMKDPTGYTGYFDFATETITNNITLYADWAEPYYVYFNANGGTGTMEPVAVYPGHDCTLPECGFTAPEGKQFKGWAFDANSTEVVQFKSFEVTGGNKTLYAIWEDAPNANPAKPTISVNGTYTYTGSEQTATVSGYDSTTMNITGNVGTNAGGYTVSVTSKTGKWADGTTDAVTADWSIQKANPTYEVPTGLEGTKGNALSTVTLPASFTWADGTTEMNTTGNQTFLATFTPSDTGNYNVVNNISVTVNVKEAAPTTYKVTVTNGTGGGNYEEGATVTLTAGAAPTGQMFDKWVVNGVVVVDVNSATTTFVMPAGNVTAEATYKNIPAGPAGHTHSYGSEWKTDADKHWHECSCGAKTEEAAHTASDWIIDTPATATTDGKKHKECTECGYVMETAKISHIAGVKPGAVKYTYSGSVKTPSVKVTDADGNVLVKDTDYSVAYPAGRKAVGKYTVKIVFKGNYEGTKSFSFTIKPKTAKIKSITATSRKLTVKAATKVSATGGTVYQIAYKQKGTSTWKYTTTTSYYKTIKSLKKGKQYYVKMRAYRKSGTTKYYGSWSTVKLSKAVK